ncbi:nucleotidyltransferase substrate binding protein [Candidatus Oscillochloris fontis]|uniref:nucleotidyltransferase substrate binding protein n=1 Tax=Candidatus Oscillochloris fontis TaxID=2496868 RepID=UPI00101BCDBF|nr:nucleotidyltransferase substrate binding protein [Candidatus Oscillochloris fontis]
MLDLTSLRNAITALRDSIEVVTNAEWFDQQSAKIQQTLISGVIQSFEFVYELSIKMLRRQLDLESASPNEVDQSSFRDLLRLAASRGLITDPQAWFEHRYMRNLTAHTYDQAKAQQVYQHALGFLADAQALLTQLESRHAAADRD